MDQDIVNGFIDRLQKLNAEYTNKIILNEVQMEKLQAILAQKDEEIAALQAQIASLTSKPEVEGEPAPKTKKSQKPDTSEFTN